MCVVCRAVYRDSEIMLLDDPLSAVDAAVSRHLFDGYIECCNVIMKCYECYDYYKVYMWSISGQVSDLSDPSVTICSTC